MSDAARAMRMAISPRLAINSFVTLMMVLSVAWLHSIPSCSANFVMLCQFRHALPISSCSGLTRASRAARSMLRKPHTNLVSTDPRVEPEDDSTQLGDDSTQLGGESTQ